MEILEVLIGVLGVLIGVFSVLVGVLGVLVGKVVVLVDAFLYYHLLFRMVYLEPSSQKCDDFFLFFSG